MLTTRTGEELKQESKRFDKTKRLRVGVTFIVG